MKKKLRNILTVLLALVFIFSAGAVIWMRMVSQREQDAFTQLAASVNRATPGQTTVPGQASTPAATGAPFTDAPAASASQAVTSHSPAPQEASTPQATYVSPYLSLKEQNADFFGWLSIGGTVIDYPVMHTPEDPEYYLHRAFDGSASRSGVPFLDAKCFDGGGIHLIYGHNMKDGSMFASLLSYAKAAYWEEHPSITFDTLDEPGTYAVVAAFYTKVYAEGEPGFRFYQTDLSSAEAFEAYVQGVQRLALYDTGVPVSYGDQLLVLVTCSYHTDNGRFVVVARKAGA